MYQEKRSHSLFIVSRETIIHWVKENYWRTLNCYIIKLLIESSLKEIEFHAELNRFQSYLVIINVPVYAIMLI